MVLPDDKDSDDSSEDSDSSGTSSTLQNQMQNPCCAVQSVPGVWRVAFDFARASGTELAYGAIGLRACYAVPDSSSSSSESAEKPSKKKRGREEEEEEEEEDGGGKKRKRTATAGQGEGSSGRKLIWRCVAWPVLTASMLLPGGLSYDATEEDVKEFFADCGEVPNAPLLAICYAPTLPVVT
eukprot:1106556-Rhodomonas_salina.2